MTAPDRPSVFGGQCADTVPRVEPEEDSVDLDIEDSAAVEVLEILAVVIGVPAVFIAALHLARWAWVLWP
jgi:hypothetical protein